jgi:hypothetical protein
MSFTDLINDAPGISFFSVIENIKAEALAIINGKIELVSLKITATIIGTSRTKLKYIITSEKV